MSTCPSLVQRQIRVSPTWLKLCAALCTLGVEGFASGGTLVGLSSPVAFAWAFPDVLLGESRCFQLPSSRSYRSSSSSSSSSNKSSKMGIRDSVRERVDKLASSLLTGWVEGNVETACDLNLRGAGLELQHLVFDVGKINSAAMGASTLLLLHATVDSLQLQFSPWHAPVATLVVRGLHLVLRPRPADDAWWQARPRLSEQQEREAALAALDPQGAGAHAAAQKLAEPDHATTVLSSFLASFALASFRIELHHCSLDLVTHPRDGFLHCGSISLQSLVLEEGFTNRVGGAGGLIGAAAAALFGLWSASRKKCCKVEGLGLRVRNVKLENAHPRAGGSSELAHNSDQDAQSDAGAMHQDSDALSGDSPCMLQFQLILIILEFDRVQLKYVEFDAPSASLGMDTKDLVAVTALVSQLQGPDDSESCGSGSSHIKQVAIPLQSRTASELWRLGFERALAKSSRRRQLAQTIVGGMRRRRYSSLYRTWLMEIGWGQRMDISNTTTMKARSKQELQKLNKLQGQLEEIERDLPIEAVALARRAARCSAAAAQLDREIHAAEKEVGDAEGVVWSYAREGVSYVKQAVIHFIHVVLAAVRHVKLAPSVWQRLQGMLGRVCVPSSASDISEQGVSPSSSLEMENPLESTSPVHSQLADEDAQGVFVRSWQVAYKAHIGSSCFTLASAASERLFEAGGLLNESGDKIMPTETMMPAVRVVFQHFSFAYGSDLHAKGASIACGSLQGEILSVVPGQVPDVHYQDWQALEGHEDIAYSGKHPAKIADSITILTSTQAESTQREFEGDCRFNEMLLGSMRSKHKLWLDHEVAMWTSKDWSSLNIEQARSSGCDQVMTSKSSLPDVQRPFLVAEFETCQPGKCSGETPNGMICCMVDMGRLECSLKSSYLTRLNPLVVQFAQAVSLSRSGCRSEAGEVQEQARESTVTLTFHEAWDHYSAMCLSIFRHYSLNYVPATNFLCSMVIQCPQLKLSASAFDVNGDLSSEGDYGNVSMSGSRREVSLVLDLGHLDVLTTPARMTEDLQEMQHLQGPGSPGSPLAQAVRNKEWLTVPPVPSLAHETVEASPEKETMGNNVLVRIRHILLMIDTEEPGQAGFPVLGPVSLVLTSSLCRNELSSLFSKTTVASAGFCGEVSELTVHAYVSEMLAILQVLASFRKVLEPFSRTERAGDSAELLPMELASLPEELEGSDITQSQVGRKSRQNAQFMQGPARPEVSAFALSLDLHLATVQILSGVERWVANQKQSKKKKDRRRSGGGDQNAEELEGVLSAWLRAAEIARIGNFGHVCLQNLQTSLLLGDGCQASVRASWDLLQFVTIDLTQAKEESHGQAEHRVLHPVVARLQTELGTSGLVVGDLELGSSDLSFTGPAAQRMDSMSGAGETVTVDGQSSPPDNSDIVIHFEIGRTCLTNGSSRSMTDKVGQAASGPDILSVHSVLRKDLRSIDTEIKGGLILLDTATLVSLLDYTTSYWELMKKTLMQPLSSNETPYANASTNMLRKQERTAVRTQRSASLSSMRSQKWPEPRPRRVSSAPPMSHLPVGTESRWNWEGTVYCSIEELSFILARSDATGSFEGLLFELDMRSNVQSSLQMKSIVADLNRLMICGLQASRVGYLNGDGKIARAPQFESGHKSLESSQSFGSSYSFGSISTGESSSGEFQVAALHSEQPNPAQSTIEGAVPAASTILEQLKVSCVLQSTIVDDVMEEEKWGSAWTGTTSFSGFDIAITTSEMQLLRSLLSPSSNFQSASKEYEADLSLAALVERSEAAPNQHDVPDGAIVAIKDDEEHLYLAVEEIPSKEGNYHLISVMHYSLAGDKALFKVNYQNTTKGQDWFTLSSLHARSPDGEPFRVHCRSGSGLAEISSTHEGSWELWHFLPHKSGKNEESDTFDRYNYITREVVHLVNQKSKSGLAIVDGMPMIVTKPGNPFKIKIISLPKETGHAETSSDSEIGVLQEKRREAATGVVAIPQVTLEFESINITLLHEAGGGMHLLPLVRVRLENIHALAQVGSKKTRVISWCNFLFDYFEAQSSQWVSITNPVVVSFFYRKRVGRDGLALTGFQKIPVSVFCCLKKVDITVSEQALDACLFLIGVLDLAGPFTIQHSPLSANQCKVANQLGVDVLCRFEQSKARIRAWDSGNFFIRHTLSRRDLSSATTTSMVDLNLEKLGAAVSTPIRVPLERPGVMALRTRLKVGEGRKAPGPIIVVDVTRQSEEGVVLTVSSMIRIRNASGCSLELRCRRPNQGEGGAVVTLEDGDVIDDATGSFDALTMQGEYRKALSSFTVGNFVLSIRPASVHFAPSEDTSSTGHTSSYDWSDDVKGAKAERVSGLFEKLHYNLRKSMKGLNFESSFQSSFATVICPSTASAPGSDHLNRHLDLHFLVRRTLRQIPLALSDVAKPQQQKKAVWHEQQELVLLPTIRLHNYLTSDIRVTLFASPAGKGKTDSSGSTMERSVVSGESVCMYAALENLVLIVQHSDLGISSKPVSVNLESSGSKELFRNSSAGDIRELEMEVDFADGLHVANLKILRGSDGVIEVFVLTRYALLNQSEVSLCYSAPTKKSSQWGLRKLKDQSMEWPSEKDILQLAPRTRVSWLNRSNRVLIRRQEPNADTAVLDLESLSGAMEISLGVQKSDTCEELVQLGVKLQLPSAAAVDPTNVILFVPRYVIVNESAKEICVCQDGFQDESSAILVLDPGERTALHAQVLPNDRGRSHAREGKDCGNDLLLSVRFRPRESGWDWSGPVCSASLGTFWLKIRSRSEELRSTENGSSVRQKKETGLWFAVADCQEESASLVMRFRAQSAAAAPYRVENALHSDSISYQQKGLNASDTLRPGASAPYAWDDLSLPRKLVVTVTGTQLSHEINLDKVRPWKLFRASRQKRQFTLQLPFQEQLQNILEDGDDDDYDNSSGSGAFDVGYEVYAEGTTRVLRISEQVDTSESQWDLKKSIPQTEMQLKVPLLALILVESEKQLPNEVEKGVMQLPIISPRMTGVVLQVGVTSHSTVCQLKAQRLDVDVKWQGAPFAAMLRVHGQDRFTKDCVLHFAAVVSNKVYRPMHVRYASLLLQAMDLNLDEETLMKLAPFYRSSLADSSAPSRQFYFDRLEIHPIKIVGSFIPGNPRADYTSAQETLRALLHSVIKIPSVRGRTVELNGVLLSHALLTYKQLALKCAQHYSWYAMRGIYMARGSELLPPAFASLFDDTAAASLDVFFDPSSGSIDFQGLTLGMFSLLSKGMLRQGQGGTRRYLGDLEKTMKSAGSNLLFAVVTEVSDNVLKGAEANGLDGMVTGFRRGILNVAMEPSLLRSAVVKGGSTRQIKLDRSVGMDEVYVEGYLQGMLDVRFKQDYLRVKVVDDQVTLKNLPPNSALIEEVMETVKSFLIGEGLLSEGSHVAGFRSMRRLQGGNERRLGPAVFALTEQLLVIIAVRMLRNQAKKAIQKLAGEPKNDSSDEVPKRQEAGEACSSESPHQEDADESIKGQVGRNIPKAMSKFVLSSAVAYVDGRVCRHIPNPFLRRIVSGFLLSFIE